MFISNIDSPGPNTSASLWTIAHQAPLSEYWSGLLCPPPGDLPDPVIEPKSLTSTCIGRQVLYHQHHVGSPL